MIYDTQQFIDLEGLKMSNHLGEYFKISKSFINISNTVLNFPSIKIIKVSNLRGLGETLHGRNSLWAKLLMGETRGYP